MELSLYLNGHATTSKENKLFGKKDSYFSYYSYIMILKETKNTHGQLSWVSNIGFKATTCELPCKRFVFALKF